MPNPDAPATALVARQDAVDRLEALADDERRDRRAEVLQWVAAGAVLSLGLFVREAFALALAYPAHWIWLRGKRRRIRQAETNELRELLESLSHD